MCSMIVSKSNPATTTPKAAGIPIAHDSPKSLHDTAIMPARTGAAMLTSKVHAGSFFVSSLFTESGLPWHLAERNILCELATVPCPLPVKVARRE